MPMDKMHDSISINFVNSFITGLRGYNGINCIYINAFYVKSRQQVFQWAPDLENDVFDIIIKMTLFCITLHELSHARLRQVCFQVPSSLLPRSKKATLIDHETVKTG